MLLSRRRSINVSNYDTAASVHNYYERLVTTSVIKQDSRANTDYDFLADVSCVALNHLPPRYIRHDVDMTFYMSPVEFNEIQEKVAEAVKYAIDFVQRHEQKKQEIDGDTEH